MASPTFDGFSLQDSTYITTRIDYRSIPNREVSLEDVSRRPGKKLISQEFGEKRIIMAGYILGDDASDLRTNIDTFHSNVTTKNSGTLVIDPNREIEAVVASMVVSDAHYAQSIVPFELEFIAAEPFWRGNELTASVTVASGTSNKSITTVISGTVFAEPSITFTSDSGEVPGGNTTTSGIKITYDSTGEFTAWSGGANSLPYSDFVKFDYENQVITEVATVINPRGVFMRWQPGETTFTVTFSGTTQGGAIDITYQPRYL